MTPYPTTSKSDAWTDPIALAESLKATVEQFLRMEADNDPLDLAYAMVIFAEVVMSTTAQNSDYGDYLDSWWWKRMAYRAKQSVGFVCVLCGAAGRDAGGDAILHAHHVDYSHKGMPREIHDLVVLCADCHAKHHGKTP